jgi:hypothetical protein
MGYLKQTEAKWSEIPHLTWISELALWHVIWQYSHERTLLSPGAYVSDGKDGLIHVLQKSFDSNNLKVGSALSESKILYLKNSLVKDLTLEPDLDPLGCCQFHCFPEEQVWIVQISWCLQYLRVTCISHDDHEPTSAVILKWSCCPLFPTWFERRHPAFQ